MPIGIATKFTKRTKLTNSCYSGMKTIAIAGGTGLIGSKLVTLWKSQGHEVRILSRGKTNVSQGIYHWDPIKRELDQEALIGVHVLVNLTGSGIADKRWSDARIQELYDSRVKTTEFLLTQAQDSPTLEHYLSASGAVCYGFDQPNREHEETDPFGTDVLSDITEKWEQAAQLFASKCSVTCVRIPVVLATDGGALPTMMGPVKFGFGSALGSGKQGVPWVHIDDLVALFDFCVQQKLSGIYNANAGNTTNKELMRTIARVLRKPFWAPAVPGFALKLILGKMASVVLDGLKTSNKLIRSKGFEFQFTDLEMALAQLLKK